MENIQQSMEENKNSANLSKVIMAAFYALLSFVCAMSVSLLDDNLDWVAIPKIIFCIAAGVIGIITSVKNIKMQPKGVLLSTLIVSGVAILYAFITLIIWMVFAMD